MLSTIIETNAFTPKSLIGIFDATSVDEDVIVSHNNQLTTLHFLREQKEKSNEEDFHYCLSDFISPIPNQDSIGLFAVTILGVEKFANTFQAKHDDYSSIMAKALGDRLAEALAEVTHKKMRDLYGFGLSENLSNEDLIKEKYRGIRPAPGYPACPDHTEKEIIWNLLEVEARIGISLTESFAMTPPSSVSGYYFNHPQARYFNVGLIGEDQIEIYAKRKDKSKTEIERWLAPNLGYEPS
jgi:5-methyltetrahydrofolate--homocysteine methyltransferase